MNEIMHRASPLYVGPSIVLVPGLWPDLVELHGVIVRHATSPASHFLTIELSVASLFPAGGQVLGFWWASCAPHRVDLRNRINDIRLSTVVGPIRLFMI
jgi:hypothetical protein